MERCFWEGREEVPEAATRAEFADPAEGEVRLLLSDPTVRPGQILSAAVANDSPDSVRYGTASHVESGGGERVRIDGPYGFRGILLGAEARAVGPCLTLPVPSSTPPGRYVAVLDDGTAKLRAEFEVAGQAILNPAWEVSLRRGRPDNRSR